MPNDTGVQPIDAATKDVIKTLKYETHEINHKIFCVEQRCNVIDHEIERMRNILDMHDLDISLLKQKYHSLWCVTIIWLVFTFIMLCMVAQMLFW